MIRQGSLGWALNRALTVHPDGEALVEGDLRLDYAQWGRRVRGLGAGLRRQLGLAPGDVVAVLAQNSHRHLECFMGIPPSGLVINDLNFRLALPELEFIVQDCAAKAIIADGQFLPTARGLMTSCSSLKHLIWAADDPAPDGTFHFDLLCDEEPFSEQDLAGIGDDTVAAICYTGGTTGLPKGVMLSHSNLLANAKHMHSAVAYRHTDRYIHAAPMFHAADQASTLALTWVGGTHVVVPGFDAAQFGRVVEQERITLALIVPTMINMLVNHPDTPSRDFSAWRLLLYGASPMPAELQKKTMQMLPCNTMQLYGMTEASPLLTACTEEDHIRAKAGEKKYLDRLRSAGCAVMGVEVEVRRPDGTRCAPGEPGEIYARGPNIMLGYWNRPEETAAALVDGWYRSGDVAYADEHGYLYIVDRAKDMIIAGGENVYTTEVENAVYLHPAVLEAAVIGVPNEQWGEAVHAEVVPKAGMSVTAAEIIAECRKHIAGYKVPRTVNIRAEPLPKSGAGKILKRDLREPFWSGRERSIN